MSRQQTRSSVASGEKKGIEIALARNRAFAAAGGQEGAVVFPGLGLLVITCLDPRVDPAYTLGLDLSDAVVVRNVGGRVTPEVIDDVAFIAQLAEILRPDPTRRWRATRRSRPATASSATSPVRSTCSATAWPATCRRATAAASCSRSR